MKIYSKDHPVIIIKNNALLKFVLKTGKLWITIYFCQCKAKILKGPIPSILVVHFTSLIKSL